MTDAPRCATCTYWREFHHEWNKPESGGSGYGQCGLIRATHRAGRSPASRLARITTAHGGNPGLNTAADFGCVEHEARS